MSEQRNSWSRTLAWVSLSGLVLALDQYTKLLVTQSLELYERIPIVPILDLVRLHNTGAAFSFLASASGWQNWLFAGIAVVVSVAIVWWLKQLPPRGKLVLATGLALVLGGALGNLIDRLTLGYVVDFILVHWRQWSYPAFNVADSAITCGVILVIYDGLILERRAARGAPSGDA